MTQKTNPDGSTYLFVYDSKGNLSSMIDPLNREIKYIYDNHNRIIKRILPDGSYLSLVYDAAGNLISQQDNLNRKSVYTYDSSGNPLSITWPDGTKTHFEYNSLNQRISTTDAANRVYNFEYDLHNHVTRVEYPDSSFVLFNYDNEGNLLSRTDELGNLSSYEYDPMGRMLATIDPAGARYENTYDAAGRRIAAKDPLGRITAYEYDVLDRVVKTVAPDATVNTADYDTVGNLLVSTNALNQQTLYEYDALGRNIEEKRVDSTTANTFDAAGQLLEMKHYKLVLDREAHDCGKGKNKKKEPTYKEEILALRQYAYDLAGNRISMTDENAKVTSYAFDNSNWLIQVVYPNSDVVAYAYNDAGDRTSEQLNDEPVVDYSYDSAGRMLSKGDESFSYDADGNMLSDALATYTWNSDNRLVKVEKNINGCKHDKDRNGHGFGHLKHSKEAVVYEEYTYLPMDWRRVTRKTGQYSFKTDRKGNARKDDESEQTFVSVYDGEDESQEYLVTESKVKFLDKCKPRKAGLKLFREFVGGPAVDDIEHTRYNRLSLAMLKDGLGSTIALTGRDGRAIARIGYDAWGEFRWDGKDNHAPCKEDDFDSYLERLENTWGFGRGEHNGWAFGRHFGSKFTPYLYTGRRFSAFTGQYNNRNRFYSPALGRFTSKDPIGFNGGMNLYRYADNNPMRWVDPFGLLTEAECERLQQEIAKWQGVKPLLVNMFKTYKEGTTWEDYGLKVLSNASGYRSKEFNELPAYIRNVLNERVYTIPNSVLQSLMLGWVGTSMLIGGNIENSLFGQGQTGIVQFWKVWVCMEYYRTNLVVEELTKLYEDDCKEGCE